MPPIDASRRAHWASRPTSWPGPLSDAAFARLAALFAAQSEALTTALLAALDDPARSLLAQTVLWTANHLRDPTLIEWRNRAVHLPDARIALATPEPPGSSARDVFEAFDRVFGDYGWTLRLRAPLPDHVDIAPILQSLRLWLTARTMAADTPAFVTYDDGPVSIEFTLVDELGDGRCLTLGPRSRPPADALDHALNAVPDATVIAVRPAQRFARHAIQDWLYGPVRTVTVDDTGYQAQATRDGWFAAHPTVAEVWWFEPAPRPDPFARVRRLTNPWAPNAPQLLRRARSCHAEATGPASATLRWANGGG